MGELHAALQAESLPVCPAGVAARRLQVPCCTKNGPLVSGLLPPASVCWLRLALPRGFFCLPWVHTRTLITGSAPLRGLQAVCHGMHTTPWRQTLQVSLLESRDERMAASGGSLSLLSSPRSPRGRAKLPTPAAEIHLQVRTCRVAVRCWKITSAWRAMASTRRPRAPGQRPNQYCWFRLPGPASMLLATLPCKFTHALHRALPTWTPV